MNHLIFWNDLQLFIGENPRSTKGHSHPVVQLVIATEGAFKTKHFKTGKWSAVKGLLIKPNHQHLCDATGVPIVSLDIDPDSALGEWIQATILDTESVIEYPSPKIQEVNTERIKTYLHHQNWQGLRTLFETTFRFTHEYERKPKDERIKNVVAYIHNNIHDLLSSSELTTVSFLSESRLLHLFKSEMGLPIRNYILWYRLKVALEHFIEGASLTEAAYLAGFSDQAHFSRTCQKMIGMPPSVILKNSKFVQVSFL